MAAYEKSWNFRLNTDITGSGTTESYAQNWMFNLFTMLSGGNGNSDAKWEIVSASDGSTVAAGGTNITTATDFVFNNPGAAHSWFVARKAMLPTTASASRYIYFTADCENTNKYQAYFAFDYETPSSAGTTTNRPTHAGPNPYAKDTQQFIPSTTDAGNPTYFHGIIDTTGSFYVFTSRNESGKYNAPFATWIVTGKHKNFQLCQ